MIKNASKILKNSLKEKPLCDAQTIEIYEGFFLTF